MKPLIPLLALLLLSGPANAQQGSGKKMKYHVSYIDQNGQPKCHNSASKEQAEKNATQMRAKRDVSQVKVG